MQQRRYGARIGRSGRSSYCEPFAMRRRAPTWRTSLPAIRDRFDITIVLVTHDIDEAVYLSDLADMFRDHAGAGLL
jgi:adenosyl cobinamide kinase/adenosyl cobinamide phosphate guanylyltransferase